LAQVVANFVRAHCGIVFAMTNIGVLTAPCAIEDCSGHELSPDVTITRQRVADAPASSSTCAPTPGFADLAEGPYSVMTAMLDARSLCALDAACSSFQTANRERNGPWETLGERSFRGVVLQQGRFCEVDREVGADWKQRFRKFVVETHSFAFPFSGSDITVVTSPDEVAYFQCHLCPLAFSRSADVSFYLEIAVQENPGSFSLALVADDGEDDDTSSELCSSVTFSPDTGTVIREQQSSDSPDSITGDYIQMLPSKNPEKPFQGHVGLYLQGDRLSFLRWCVQADAHMEHAVPEDTRDVHRSRETDRGWECTGFVSDLSWASGRLLRPCLAFCHKGTHEIRIAHVGRHPPVMPRSLDLPGPSRWTSFDWS